MAYLKKCCIIVPIYKPLNQLDANEIISFNQLIEKLKQHDIILIGPSGVDWANYSSVFAAQNISIQVKIFNDFFFRNIAGYNLLFTRLFFFTSFKRYDFMLIYQLDAFIFKDEVNFWYEKNFDYIGAPWFDGWDNPSIENKIIGVGNGGFSLRKIESAIKILKRVFILKLFTKISKKLPFLKSILFSNFCIKKLRIKAGVDLDYLLKTYCNINEDYFWGQIAPSYFDDYVVSDIQSAIEFSFEVNPSFLFKQNGEKLPLGCHAWMKYEPEFWRNYISF